MTSCFSFIFICLLASSSFLLLMIFFLKERLWFHSIQYSFASIRKAKPDKQRLNLLFREKKRLWNSKFATVSYKKSWRFSLKYNKFIAATRGEKINYIIIIYIRMTGITTQRQQNILFISMSTIQFRLHRKQQQQQYPLMNLKDCRPIINSIVIWIIHFAISTAVLAVGAITNHGER